MVNGQCLTTMVTTSWRSSGQDMGFGGLGMANSKSGDYNLFSSGQVLELLWWPQCWFHKIEVSAMYSYIPLGLNQLLNVRVDQWFHICIVDTCQWVYLLVEGLFCYLVYSFISVNATVAWYPAETNTGALVTQWPEQVHDMANKRVLGVFTLNCLQTGHWVRVDYHIMMDWAHVLVVVQCQTDGRSLSSKDGAVVWQSFGQLAAGCLTILEMAVDDRRCPHSLVHFWAISVDFIMWSLCFTKLIELSLGFLSGDHAFTYSFNEVVSLGIIVMRSWWKVGCPQGADQFGIDLCRGHGLLYFETNGRGRGSGHASSSIWPASIQISSGSVEFMQSMMCWIVNAGTSFQIVMHGQL